MKQLNQEEAKRICDRVIGFSKADECRVSISGGRTGNIRYAQNSVSTAGLVENTELTVSVAFGKRQGTATINEFDEKSLEKAVRRAEDVARLAPENPEFMPAVRKQAFKASNTFRLATVAASGNVPPVNAFDSVMMSGVTPAFWQANIDPVRPKPVKISSKINSVSWRSASFLNL